MQDNKKKPTFLMISENQEYSSSVAFSYNVFLPWMYEDRLSLSANLVATRSTTKTFDRKPLITKLKVKFNSLFYHILNHGFIV